jgi:hypothetical protein
MRGNVKVFTLASVALLSCRAVLGIEDIEEGAADGGTTGDAATDSVGTDSATGDTGVDTGVDAGPNAECLAMAGTECGKCCRTSNMTGNGQLEQALKPCLCADGGCANDACKTTSICGGASEPKDTPCIPCVDGMVKSSSCLVGRDECAKTPTCKAAYDCLAACK